MLSPESLTRNMAGLGVKEIQLPSHFTLDSSYVMNPESVLLFGWIRNSSFFIRICLITSQIKRVSETTSRKCFEFSLKLLFSYEKRVLEFVCPSVCTHETTRERLKRFF